MMIYTPTIGCSMCLCFIYGNLYRWMGLHTNSVGKDSYE